MDPGREQQGWRSICFLASSFSPSSFPSPLLMKKKLELHYSHTNKCTQDYQERSII